MAAFSILKRLTVFDTGFLCRKGEQRVHQRLVKGGRHADGLGKNGGLSVPGYPVQGFIPPVVGGDAQGFHRGGSVPHERGFLFQAEAGDEVPGPLLRRKAAVFIGLGQCRQAEGEGPTEKEESFHRRDIISSKDTIIPK